MNIKGRNMYFRVPLFELYLCVCCQLHHLKAPDSQDGHDTLKLAHWPLDWNYSSEIKSAFMGLPQCRVMNSQCSVSQELAMRIYGGVQLYISAVN